MTFNLFTKPVNKQMIALILGATAITGGVIYYGVSQFGILGKTTPPTVETLPEIKKVTALGRLEPETEVIKLSAPITLDSDSVLAVMVAEGDKVSKGQIIAVLDSRDRLKDAALIAEKQVAMARAKLAQVKAGAKTGDIQAQQAAVGRFQAQIQGDKVGQQEIINRLAAQLVGDRDAQLATIGKLSAELKNATAEYERYRQLSQQGAISASLFDTKGLSVETARQQLHEAKAILTRIEATGNKQISEAKIALSRINATGSKQVTEAKATLSSVAEVRGVDITAAQAEIENATASWQRAKTEAEQAYIRAPIAGQILKIHSRPGEKISDDGIAQMAQNQQMVAVAEVYQSDISQVKLGQKATITSQAFSGELRGTVSQIGLQVNRQNTFANQPGENMDRRVIEVKILINQEDANRVSGLTNLQVQTVIEL
jgi:HlyD family secretion protein